MHRSSWPGPGERALNNPVGEARDAVNFVVADFSIITFGKHDRVCRYGGAGREY
jgi:hypothetical protein